jgi:hypothetical protein
LPFSSSVVADCLGFGIRTSEIDYPLWASDITDHGAGLSLTLEPVADFFDRPQLDLVGNFDLAGEDVEIHEG